MPRNTYQQTIHLVSMGLRCDWQEKERTLSGLFFSLALLLLCTFLLENFSSTIPAHVRTIATVFFTFFLTIQVVLVRIFSFESEDGAFELLQTRRVAAFPWFCAKVIHCLLNILVIFTPAILLATLFVRDSPASTALIVGAILLLGGVGLVALGLLLSAIVLTANGKEVLFPVLFFPLATPVLITTLEAAIAFLSADGQNSGWPWIGIVCGFDIIYVTLGILLFGEIVHSYDTHDHHQTDQVF